MGWQGPGHPVPLATHPRAQSGGSDGTQRGARQANSFPIAEQVGGKTEPTLITRWLKQKKKLGVGGREEARPGHGISPHLPPHAPHLWAPINICRGRQGYWPWQGWVRANPISGSARSRWSRCNHLAWSAAHSAQTAAGCSAGPQRPPCSAGLQGWAPRRDTAGHKLWSLS